MPSNREIKTKTWNDDNVPVVLEDYRDGNSSAGDSSWFIIYFIVLLYPWICGVELYNPRRIPRAMSTWEGGACSRCLVALIGRRRRHADVQLWHCGQHGGQLLGQPNLAWLHLDARASGNRKWGRQCQHQQSDWCGYRGVPAESDGSTKSQRRWAGCLDHRVLSHLRHGYHRQRIHLHRHHAQRIHAHGHQLLSVQSRHLRCPHTHIR